MKATAGALSAAGTSSAAQLPAAAAARGSVRASPAAGQAKRWLLRPLQPGQPGSSSLLPVAALNGEGQGPAVGAADWSSFPFQLSDDPLLRRSQLLLAASRRLRGEEPFPTPLADAELDPSAPRTVAGNAASVPDSPAVVSPLPFTRVGGTRPALTTFQSAASPDAAAGASLGELAVAAARMSTSTASPAGLLAAATAAAAVPSLMAPAAASASPASAAAAAAATPGAAAWLAIDNLLSEAAYSLSQQVRSRATPRGRASKESERLILRRHETTASYTISHPPCCPAALLLPQLDNSGLGGRTLASKTAVWSSAGGSLPEVSRGNGRWLRWVHAVEQCRG